MSCSHDLMKRPDVGKRQVDVRRERGSYLEAGFLYVVPGEGLGSTAAAGALAAAPADRSSVMSTVMMGQAPMRSDAQEYKCGGRNGVQVVTK